jgi:hypothetical protein
MNVKVGGKPAARVDDVAELRRDLCSVGADPHFAADRHIPFRSAADVDIVGAAWHADALAADRGKDALEGSDGQLAFGAADIVVGERGLGRAFDANEGQFARDGVPGLGVGHVEAEQTARVPVGGKLAVRWRARRVLLENALRLMRSGQAVCAEKGKRNGQCRQQ